MTAGRPPAPPGDGPARGTPLYPRWANRAMGVAIAVLFVTVLAGPALLMAWVRTPDLRRQFEPVAQPVPFSHPVHVTGLRIDCRYCHATVERAAYAGMPSTATCVPCHSDTFLQSATMAPVRASLATERPIAWRRVNGVPDFVYFNHAAHVTRGVGCESCHGRVDRMAQVYQAEPLTMGWCLGCHRDPAPNLRPLAEITTMGYVAPDTLGAALMREYAVRRLTDCTTCHR
ncbi:MAG TPA: cytochrome c3 family protein [Gemmatimonadaceae bacterium]